VVAGSGAGNAKDAPLLQALKVVESVPSVVQVIVNVVACAALSAVRFCGTLTLTLSGTSPVLPRQKDTDVEWPGARDASVKPGIGVVVVAGQLPAIARAAVAEVRLFGDSATVFDVRFANVIPPTNAATAPTVPTARNIGLIL